MPTVDFEFHPAAPGGHPIKAWTKGALGAGQDLAQMRIDSVKQWVVPLMWDQVFPPFSEKGDAEEVARVDPRDRNSPKD